METSSIILKWGTLKGWNLKTKKEKNLLKEYFKYGVNMGCAQQEDTPGQKEIICKLIDECNNPKGIFLDWDGKYISKEKAKKYVLEYNK